MNWMDLFDALLSTQTPLLPDPLLWRWGRRLCGGIVLAALGLWLGRHGTRRVRVGLGVLLLVWSLVPGPLSPTYWLGLAFQSPSLMTTVIAVYWSVAQLRTSKGDVFGPASGNAWGGLAATGIALGWLLLLDTFALLPFSLYATGFSPAAVGLAGVLACLPWVMQGSQPSARGVSLLLIAVLLLYVLLRLPSGNLWDALLDPLLWLALHGFWLRRGLRWLRAWRAAAAIRV